MNKYYLITSGTTYWYTNPARHDVADNINGPYVDMGNPCVGRHAEHTFMGQSTYVLPLQGKDDAYIFMADRWIPTDLKYSRYLWLPIKFIFEEHMEIKWADEWTLDVFRP